MKIFSVLLLLPFVSMAKVRMQNGAINPTQLKDYPLIKFVEDSAKVMNKTILFKKGLLSQKKIDINLGEKIDIKAFESIFEFVLSSKGYSLTNEKPFYRIIKQRNSRYMPSPVYSSKETPTTANYILTFHQLKYPLANEATRNLRPFMSRYARVISLNDGHIIIFHEQGHNTKRLLKIIDTFDTKLGYEKMIKRKKNKKKNKNNKEYKKIKGELEIATLEKDILKEKLKEYMKKEEKQRGKR